MEESREPTYCTGLNFSINSIEPLGNRAYNEAPCDFIMTSLLSEFRPKRGLSFPFSINFSVRCNSWRTSHPHAWLFLRLGLQMAALCGGRGRWIGGAGPDHISISEREKLKGLVPFESVSDRKDLLESVINLNRKNVHSPSPPPTPFPESLFARASKNM